MEAGRPGPILRKLVPLSAALAVAAPGEVTAETPGQVRAGLAEISDMLSAAYLR